LYSVSDDWNGGFSTCVSHFEQVAAVPPVPHLFKRKMRCLSFYFQRVSRIQCSVSS